MATKKSKIAQSTWRDDTLSFIDVYLKIDVILVKRNTYEGIISSSKILLNIWYYVMLIYIWYGGQSSVLQSYSYLKLQGSTDYSSSKATERLHKHSQTDRIEVYRHTPQLSATF